MLISFEGIDGSGKTTQINLLKRRMEYSGYEVHLFREPGGTEVSELIRGMLLNPELNIHPITELLLFSAARAQLVSESVKPLLEKGSFVILDRFYDSTAAYQGFGREALEIGQIHILNKIASHQTIPDITFYLKIDISLAHDRKGGRTRDRMEQSGDVFYEKVIEGFNRIAADEERIIVLDASKSEEQLHHEVWVAIEKKITND